MSGAIERAKPYLKELDEWMDRNGVTLVFSTSRGWEREDWLIYPHASREDIRRLCIPYFDTQNFCHECPWGPTAHIMVQYSDNAYLHICTRMAEKMGILKSMLGRRQMDRKME